MLVPISIYLVYTLGIWEKYTVKWRLSPTHENEEVFSFSPIFFSFLSLFLRMENGKVWWKLDKYSFGSVSSSLLYIFGVVEYKNFFLEALELVYCAHKIYIYIWVRTENTYCAFSLSTPYTITASVICNNFSL